MTRQGKVKAIPVIWHDLGRERERRKHLTFKNWFYRPKRGSLMLQAPAAINFSDVFFNRMRTRVSLGQHVLKVI